MRGKRRNFFLLPPSSLFSTSPPFHRPLAVSPSQQPPLMSNYSTGNDRFNHQALTWDTQPEVVQSSLLCHTSLVSHLGPTALSSYDVLEIGCGTGLLTIPLSADVRSIIALDTAQGMIDMLLAKVEGKSVEGKVKAHVKLLEDPDDGVLRGKRFDLVLSHLVFHHVPDMRALVRVMLGTLKSGGRIWISDFQDDGPQAERFHPKDKVRFCPPSSPATHPQYSSIEDEKTLTSTLTALTNTQHAGVERHGLKRQEMHSILVDAGFRQVNVFESFRLTKVVEGGAQQEFPFLAITGVRP